MTPDERTKFEQAREDSDVAMGAIHPSGRTALLGATKAAGYAMNVAQAWMSDSLALRVQLCAARREIDDVTARNATLQGELVEKQKALEQVRIANTAVQSSYQQERTESARLRGLVEVLRTQNMERKHLELERAVKRLLDRSFGGHMRFRLKKQDKAYEAARVALGKLVGHLS